MADPDATTSESAAARLDLGRRLRDLRVSREWSQGELAARVDMSLSSISAYERGTRAVSLEALATICGAYDLLVTDLLTDLYPYGSRTPPSRTTSRG